MTFPRYPAYKDSGVAWLGVIPAHWAVNRIKHVCAFVYGDALIEDVRVNGDVQVFGSNGPIGLHNEANTTAPVIIVGRKGSHGKVTFSPNQVFVIDTAYYIDERHTKYDIHWLYYTLLSLKLDSVSQDTGVPGLSREKAYATHLSLPLLAEQRAIAAFLDAETARIDTLVAKQTALIATLQEKRRALISHVVTKGLDPAAPMKDSGVPWLGAVPQHWEVKRLKHVTSFVTSGSRGWAEYYSDAGSIFLRIGNLTRDSVNLDLSDIQRVTPPDTSEGKRTLVQKNDVLVSITADIGSVAVVDADIGEAYVNQHLALTRPTSEVNPKWLGYCLFADSGKQQFIVSMNGGTKLGLGLDDVNNVSLLFPPLDEQAAIVAFIESETAQIDTLIAKAEEMSLLLREHRVALIAAAVTGQIDVRGWAAGV